MEILISISSWICTFLNFLILILALIDELKWSRREHIRYSNFRKKIKEFNREIKKRHFIGYIITNLFVLVMLVVLYISNLNSLFFSWMLVIFLSISLLFSLLGMYILYSKKFYNKDVTSLYSSYELINQSFANKEKVNKDIKEFEAMKEHFIVRNGEFVNRLKSITEEKIEDSLANSIQQIDDVILDLNNILNGFGNSIIDDFNAYISAFFNHNNHQRTTLKGFSFTSFDKERIQTEIIENRKQAIAEFASRVILGEKYITVDAQWELYNLLSKLSFSINEDEVKAFISYINKNEANRRKVMEKIYNEKSFNEDIFMDLFYNQKYLWLLDYVYKVSLEKQKKIVLFIIDEDKKELVQNVISFLETEALLVIDECLGISTKQNKTKKMFEVFVELNNGMTEIHGSRAKYGEDIYRSLVTYEHQHPSDSLKKKLDFYENSVDERLFVEALLAAHAEILNGKNALCEATLLNIYSIIENEKAIQKIDKTVLINLFHELRFLLDFKALEILNLLVLAFIVLYETDKQAKMLINRNSNVIEDIDTDLYNNVLKAISPHEMTSTLFSWICKDNNKHKTISIVNRVEKERTLYQSIASFSRGGIV